MLELEVFFPPLELGFHITTYFVIFDALPPLGGASQVTLKDDLLIDDGIDFKFEGFLKTAKHIAKEITCSTVAALF